MSGLNEKQHRAIAALLVEPSIVAAAGTVGVAERTMHRWLAESDFRAAYLAARREAVSQAIAQLQRIAGEAAIALQSIMNDGSKPAHARVAAARAVLEFGIKAVEIEDLAARVAALEEKAGHEQYP